MASTAWPLPRRPTQIRGGKSLHIPVEPGRVLGELVGGGSFPGWRQQLPLSVPALRGQVCEVAGESWGLRVVARGNVRWPLGTAHALHTLGSCAGPSGCSLPGSFIRGRHVCLVNTGPGTWNRCPVSARIELFSSMWSMSGRIKCFNRMILPDGILSTETVVHFQGEKKVLFLLLCFFLIAVHCYQYTSVALWLWGPTRAWSCSAVGQSWAPCTVTVTVKPNPGRTRVFITESRREGLCLRYPWDLRRDKVSRMSSF